MSSGNVSGLNLVHKVKFMTIFNYWVVGIPISYYTMFECDWALFGLWIGPTMAVTLNFFFYQYFIRTADW